MRELSLFSGAGGGLLATKHLLGWTTIGYVEIDDYCQQVLAQRIKDGYLDNAPIYTDIEAFIDSGCARLYQEITDVITAGFPCQPFSVAGKQQGQSDKRNLWPQTRDIVSLVRPRFILLENVPGLLVHEYIWQILSEITEMGYDCRWGVISAQDVGAPHLRNRVWFIAESRMVRRLRGACHKDLRTEAINWNQTEWCQDRKFVEVAPDYNFSVSRPWTHKPPIQRVVDGISYQMDRLKTIGNGQVPKVVEVAWKVLSGIG